MNELLAHIPDDKNLYVGRLLKEPFLSTVFGQAYSLRVRPLRENGRTIDIGKAEVVLASGEVLPVTVTGDAHIHPTTESVRTGRWMAGDQTVFIKDTDLTEQQVPLVRLFVQRQDEHTENP